MSKIVMRTNYKSHYHLSKGYWLLTLSIAILASTTAVAAEDSNPAEKPQLQVIVTKPDTPVKLEKKSTESKSLEQKIRDEYKKECPTWDSNCVELQQIVKSILWIIDRYRQLMDAPPVPRAAGESGLFYLGTTARN